MRSSGSSKMTSSGRRAGPSCAAWETLLKSPVTWIPELPASSVLRDEADSLMMMVRNVGVICAVCSPGGQVALTERTRHDLADIRDARRQCEILPLLGPQIHEPTRVRPHAWQVR